MKNGFYIFRHLVRHIKPYGSCEKSRAKIPGNSKHHSKAPAHGVSNYCSKVLARNDRIFYSSTILATKKSTALATLPTQGFILTDRQLAYTLSMDLLEFALA